jgi:hypothetical protein
MARKHQSILLAVFSTVLVGILTLVTQPVASAQTTKGSISGTVQDQQGASIGGADVKVTNKATGETETVTSDNNGSFRINLLSIGTYAVEITKTGFRKLVIAAADVNSSQDTGLGQLQMEVGDVAATVEVSGAAPLIDSTEAQITTNFGNATLESMPSIQANQGLDNLALFVPGVSNTRDTGFSNTNGVGFAVEGIRGRNNDQQIDGQYNNDNSVGGPGVFLSDTEFVQEYQLTTNNMSAEYGRNSGSVVNILTKNGGNTVHGSIYGTEGNSGLDALETQQKAFEGLTQVPHYNDSFAGATVGGPMVKDHLFYFGGFDTEIIPGNSVDSTGSLTPTPLGIAELEGCYPYIDPTTKLPGISPALQVLTKYGPYGITAGNPIPQNLTTIDYASAPVPNDGGTGCSVQEGGVQRTLSTASHSYNFIYRMDLNTEKNHFSGRYIYNKATFFNTNAFGTAAAGYPASEPGLGQQYSFGWVRTISSNMTNEFRLSYGRENFGFGGNTIGNTVPTAAAITDALASISLGNGNLSFGPADNAPQGRIVNQYQGQDNLTWNKGRHSFKFGVNLTYQRSPNFFLPNVNGTYSYVPQGSITTPAYVNMALNTATSVNVTAGNPILGFKETDTFLYAQDDFKLKKNLTLNLGLTWSYYGQPANLFNQLTTKQQAGSEPFWNPALPTSVTTFPSIPAPKASFGPNVGFAWTPEMNNWLFGNNKTTIRGGYRLAYDPPFYNIYLNISSAAPNALAQTISPTSIGGPLPSIPVDPFGPAVRSSLSSFLTFGVDDPRSFNQTNITPNFGPQRTSRWSFGIQRELSPNAALEVRYVGNHAGNLFQSVNANPYIAGIAADFPSLVPAGETPCSAADAVVPSAVGRVSCNEGVIRQRTNTAYSDYDGVEVELRTTNLFHQLSMRAGYTYSKTTDNADEIFGTFGAGGGIAFSQDPQNFTGAEHGLSALDFPQQFTLLATESLPFYREQHGVVGHLVGGWAVSAAYILTSGQPYTPQQEFISASTSNSQDVSFNSAFAGVPDGGARPFVSNPAVSPTQVGIYAGDACGAYGVGCSLMPSELLSLNAINNGDAVGTPVTKAQVRFIANGGEADTVFGTPFGDAARNSLRDNKTNNVNLSIFKNVKFWERVTVQLHLDMLNAFNHVQYGSLPGFSGIDPFIEDAGIHSEFTGFADPTVQASTARSLRAGLRIVF